MLSFFNWLKRKKYAQFSDDRTKKARLKVSLRLEYEDFRY